MSDITSIEWADATWNPVSGCTKVSPGCAYCYAARVGRRMGWAGPDRTGTFGPGEVAIDPSHRSAIRLQPERLELPFGWRKPRRVFVNSMSDLFHEDVSGEFIYSVFNVMAIARRHTFLVLTKRPERMRIWFERLSRRNAQGVPVRQMQLSADWPLPNVWLGVSVENQRMAERRIPALMETPAAVRFVSCEPLLGPLDLTPILTLLDWVIVGGESGGPPERRLVTACCRKGSPFEPSVSGAECRSPESGCTSAYDWRPTTTALGWVRSLRDQAVAAAVPFFLKQWGGPTARSGGRVLDGRTWDEVPAPAGVMTL